MPFKKDELIVWDEEYIVNKDWRYWLEVNKHSGKRKDIEDITKAESNENKLVSIVLPTKNGAMYLREALKSIKAQNLDRPYEILAIDSDSFGCCKSPSITCRSVRHTPQACTATRISSAPGDGLGNSASRKGRSCASRTMALMCVQCSQVHRLLL